MPEGSIEPRTDPAVVDVVIVNWNTAEAAIEAARAIKSSEGVVASVTIVDNASAPQQRAQLTSECPEDVRLILSETNLGYGKAANLALNDSAGSFVCVSNADVLAKRDTLCALVKASCEIPNAGIVGPVFGDATDSYHDALPNPATLVIRTMIGRFGRTTIEIPAEGDWKRVEQPSGAFFLVRRSVWEDLKGFDPGFFLWYEDVDLARRSIAMGHVNAICGSAQARHQGAQAFVQLDGPALQAIRLASLRRYIEKHHRHWMPLARPLLWLSNRVRARGATPPTAKTPSP